MRKSKVSRATPSAGEASVTVGARLVEARMRQTARAEDTPLRVNADLQGRALRRGFG